MGTALTGLEIRDTYDALLKISDNGPLDGTLQTVTDGLGFDSALALSTAGASVTGTFAVSGNSTFDTTTLVVDATNNRVGVGTATPTQTLDVTGSLAVSGAATFDTTTLVVDATNNRVGVGTATPASTLDVSGTLAVSSGLTAATGSFLGSSANGTLRAEIAVESPASNNTALIAKTSNGGNDIFRWFDGATQLGVFKNSGNVGIGTASPSVKTEISGSASGDFAALALTNTNQAGSADAATLNFKLGRSVDSFLFTVPAVKFVKEQQWTSDGSTVDGALTFSTIANESTSEKMRINSAGNVGIGTSAPNRLLEVSSGGDNAYIRVTGSRGNANDVHVGNIEFFNSFSTRLVGEVRGITGTGGTQSNSGQLAFYTNNDGTYAERLRITSTGNVGIGTSAPIAKLNVADAGLSTLALTATGEATDQKNWVYQYGATVGAGTFRLRASNDALTDGQNAVIITRTGFNVDTHQFLTSGSERMRITSAGNVGIGTSSPDNVLDLGQNTAGRALTWDNQANVFTTYSSGDLVLSNNFYGSTASDSFLTSTTATFGAAGMRVSATGGGSSGGYVSFFTDEAAAKTAGAAFTPTERMRITPAGNVGIGTSSPNTQLEVSIAASVGGVLRLNNARTLLFDGDVNGSIQFSNNEETAGASGVRSAITSLLRDVSGKTDVVFTTAGSGVAATEKLRILADGGITFNGDTLQVNALDDYEEGTFTYSITFGGGSTGITYNHRTGTYTKIGNKVTVNGLISLTNKGSDTGDARITGLPFTIPNAVQNYTAPSFQLFNITFANQVFGYGVINTTQISMNEMTEAGAVTTLTNADFANNSEVIIGFTYFTA